MRQNRTITVAKLAAIASVVPVLVFAYSTGPPAVKTGAPGEGTCRDCHRLNGTGGGKVEVSFSGNSLYSAGLKQQFTVTITDPDARWYGFQLSARIAADNTQAGTLAAATGESGIRVICANDAPRPASGCPSTAPVEYVEHSPARQVNTFRVEWTPPSTDRGPVNIYVAANAANGDGNNTGDDIYTAIYTLNPQSAASASAPKFSATTVVNAASLSKGISPASFMTIFGENLAPRVQTWDGAVQGTTLPTQVEGVSVSVSGKPAYPSYVSPAQLNVLLGSDSVTGPVEVRVTTAQGSSTANVSMQRYAPGFFLNSLDRKYAVATHGDNAFVARTGLAPASRPAQRGEVITLWGTGFGPTADQIPSGQVLLRPYPLVNVGDLRITLGGKDARVTFAGMTIAGVVQINAVIPADVADGDQVVVAEIAGARTQDNTFLTVQRAAAVASIQIAYRLDPWLISGNYGQGFWASPAVLGPTSQGTSTFAIEIRAEGLDAQGNGVNIDPDWIQTDPGMLTLSPGQGSKVKLTIQRAGQCNVRVRSNEVFKDLSIKAEYLRDNVIQVEITQR